MYALKPLLLGLFNCFQHNLILDFIFGKFDHLYLRKVNGTGRVGVLKTKKSGSWPDLIGLLKDVLSE